MVRSSSFIGFSGVSTKLAKYYKNISDKLKRFYKNYFNSKLLSRFIRFISFSPYKSTSNNYPKKDKKNELLSKIFSFYTKTTNKYFINIIILFCFITCFIAFYEQQNYFKRQSFIKANLAHQRIAKFLKNYQQSLEAVDKLIAEGDLYDDADKIVKLLQLSYITDKDISLQPLSWHNLAKKNNYYTAFGSSIDYENTNGNKTDSEDSLSTKTNSFNLEAELTKTSDKLFIYDQFDQQHILNLVLIYPIFKEDNQKYKKLIGYLKLPVKFPSILQILHDKLGDDDLIKITTNRAQTKDKVEPQEFYFSKQRNVFSLNEQPSLSQYQFSDSIDLLKFPYQISIGQNKKHLTQNIITAMATRCSYLLILGSLLLLSYNFLERKKAQKLYNDNLVFVNEISVLEEQVHNLNTKLENSNKELAHLSTQNQNYNRASLIINDIEDEINRGFISSLIKIQDVSFLKQHTSDQLVTAEMLNNTLGNIHMISGDLVNNIVNRQGALIEVNIAQLFEEILSIFTGPIFSRSIKINQKIDNLSIMTNELILKQILVTLLIKTLYSCPEESELKIATHTESQSNKIVIEITNNGYGINEKLLKSILDHSRNDLPLNIANIQLETKTIEKISTELLFGEFSISSKNHLNKFSLSLPIYRNKYDTTDNVVPFALIKNAG